MQIVLGLVITMVFGLILAFPVMLLWNGALIAAIPGLMSITWFQAFGIMLLCSLLFKTTVNTN